MNEQVIIGCRALTSNIERTFIDQVSGTRGNVDVVIARRCAVEIYARSRTARHRYRSCDGGGCAVCGVATDDRERTAAAERRRACAAHDPASPVQTV